MVNDGVRVGVGAISISEVSLPWSPVVNPSLSQNMCLYGI